MDGEVTPEQHIEKLKFLQKWLSRNPNKQKIVDEEAAAVQWAIDQLESN